MTILRPSRRDRAVCGWRATSLFRLSTRFLVHLGMQVSTFDMELILVIRRHMRDPSVFIIR